MKKIEIIFTLNSKQELLEIKNDLILIGNASNCHFKYNVQSSNSVIAMIRRIENGAEVVSLDPAFMITTDSGNFEKLKLKDSAFFKIGELNIILNFCDINPHIETELNLEESTKSNSENYIEDNGPLIIAQKKQLSHNPEIPIDPRLVEIDGEYCDIVFDETRYTPELKLYKEVEFDTELYNNPYDSDISADDPSFLLESSEGAIEIFYLNNNIVLDVKYFSSAKVSNILLTKNKSSKNSIQIHDLPQKKIELLKFKGDGARINAPEGYKVVEINNDITTEITSNSILFKPEVKLVLTKGTSQIIINQASSPPKIQSDSFEMDERMVKVQGVVWGLTSLMIISVWFFGDIPKIETMKPKEVVVIYKKKPKKEVSIAKDQPKVVETELPKSDLEPEKSTAKAKPVVKKVVTKQTPSPVKKTIKKFKELTNKIAVSKSISKKVETRKVVKKTYNFNIASNIKKNLGTSSNNLAAVQAEKVFVTDIAKGTIINRAISSENIDTTGVSTQGYSVSETSKVKNNSGVKGLGNNKKGVATAYIETTTKVLGAIDPELIRKILREHIPQFRYCYQRELNLKNDSLEGVFDLYFQISSNGEGNNVKIVTKGSGFGPSGTDCIRKVVSMIKFPRPKGGGVVDVKQPMNFFSNKN